MAIVRHLRFAVAWWPVVFILIVGLAAYASSLDGAFLLDDRPGILGNPRIRQLWPPGSWSSGTLRPVVELSLALNYAVGGLRPQGYHAVNVALHLGTALALYGLLRRTLAASPFGVPDTLRLWSQPLALAISVLWAVHPLTTSAVDYVIQRAEVMAALCTLATLYSVHRVAFSHRPVRWTAAAIIWCGLGMGTKPIMVTCPLIALLYDRTFLAGSFRDALTRRGWVHGGLMLTWAVLAWLLFIVPPESEPTAGFGHRSVSPMAYALTQPGVIWHYVRLAIWPHPLVIDYAWPAARSLREILWPALGLLGVFALTAWALIRRPGAGFLGVLIFAVLAPSSSVIPLSVFAFEHRMYLPLAGMIALLVLGAAAAASRCPPHRRPAVVRGLVACGMLAAVALGAATIRRHVAYRDELAMWGDVAHARPRNARAHINIGYLLAQQGNLLGALPPALEGVRLRPDDKMGRLDLGYVLAKLGRYDEAAAQFIAVLERDPSDPEGLNNLGLTLAAAGRLDDAIQCYRIALAGGDSADLRNNLGRAYQQLGRYHEAADQYRQALRLHPGLETARRNLRMLSDQPTSVSTGGAAR